MQGKGGWLERLPEHAVSSVSMPGTGAQHRILACRLLRIMDVEVSPCMHCAFACVAQVCCHGYSGLCSQPLPQLHLFRTPRYGSAFMDLFALFTQYEPASEACEAMPVCVFCSEAASVQRMLVCSCTGMLARRYIQSCPVNCLVCNILLRCWTTCWTTCMRSCRSPARSNMCRTQSTLYDTSMTRALVQVPCSLSRPSGSSCIPGSHNNDKNLPTLNGWTQ